MNVMVATPKGRSQFYLDLLCDKNPNVRKKAAQSLGQIGEQAILPRLETQLKLERNTGVQQAICEAISQIRESD
jgi:HEAT repeat protein